MFVLMTNDKGKGKAVPVIHQVPCHEYAFIA